MPFAADLHQVPFALISFVVRQAPAESRIPVFLKQPSVPSQLPLRNTFTLRTVPTSARNDKPSKRLELFGRNKVGALPVKPMSTKTSVVPAQQRSFEPTSGKSDACSATFCVKSDNVKNSRVSDIVEEARWQPIATSSPVFGDAVSTVTAAHVGRRVCVSGSKVFRQVFRLVFTFQDTRK